MLASVKPFRSDCADRLSCLQQPAKVGLRIVDPILHVRHHAQRRPPQVVPFRSHDRLGAGRSEKITASGRPERTGKESVDPGGVSCGRRGAGLLGSSRVGTAFTPIRRHPVEPDRFVSDRAALRHVQLQGHAVDRRPRRHAPLEIELDQPSANGTDGVDLGSAGKQEVACTVAERALRGLVERVVHVRRQGNHCQQGSALQGLHCEPAAPCVTMILHTPPPLGDPTHGDPSSGLIVRVLV